MLSEAVEGKILFIRGHRVMLDADLAEIYRVTTKRLNEQVKRNRSRFPEDFMFQLTIQEVRHLRSQIATSSLQSSEINQHIPGFLAFRPTPSRSTAR